MWAHTATYCNTLQHTATYCITLILQHIAIYCNTLQHTALHCTTLHHIAPHCTTLHHTAPHCTTLHNMNSYPAEYRRSWLGTCNAHTATLCLSSTTHTLQHSACPFQHTDCNALLNQYPGESFLDRSFFTRLFLLIQVSMHMCGYWPQCDHS